MFFLLFVSQNSLAVDISVNNCVLQAEKVIDLPSQLEGILLNMIVHEGDLVVPDQILAVVDDEEAKMQVKVAQNQLYAAAEKAKDKIEIEYAQASEAVAKQELKGLLEANAASKGSITRSDISKSRLEVKRAGLLIKKSTKEKLIFALERNTKQTELEASKMRVTKSTITSPFHATVEKFYRHQSEWVKRGEPVMQLIRLDVIEVLAKVDAKQVNPSEVRNCKATVTIHLAGGRKENVTGRISFVSAKTNAISLEYAVRIKIDNFKENGGWVLNPGQKATLQIHLGTASLSKSRLSPAVIKRSPFVKTPAIKKEASPSPKKSVLKQAKNLFD